MGPGDDNTRTSEIELELVQRQQSQDAEDQAEPDMQSLPRPDGGKDALLFLSSVFIFEAIVWGFPFTFGVYQNYYATHEPFAGDESGIAAIGSTGLGAMYFLAPLSAVALQRYPQARKPCMVYGVGIIVCGLVGASFCSSIAGLIATQGVLCAIGGTVAYFPAMQMIDEWFVARRGFAYACVWAGGPVAGCILPFVMQWLLNTWGYRTALRTWAVTVVLLLGPSIYFIKPRLPVSGSSASRPHDYTFLKKSPFYWYLGGNILQSFGFFLPTLWMPTFARDFGFPSFAGPLGLALYNIAAGTGALISGTLVDRFHVTVDLLYVTTISMIAVFVFWGLASVQPMFYLFAIMWGLSAGSYSSSWAGYANAIKSHAQQQIDTSMIISLMAAGKGFSAVISGPLSARLLELNPWTAADFAYGSNYGVMIVFTGICVTLGGSAWMGRMMRLI